MAGTGKFNVGNTKSSKLTGVEVMQIREKYAQGIYTMNRLAREYHVTRNTISDIVHCITWQDLPGIAPQDVVDQGVARSMAKLNALLDGDNLPAGVEGAELDAATLAVMELAVQSMPQPEFLRPDADMAARMAAYGVRPPVPKDLIEALARPSDPPVGDGLATSKPAIQAQPANESPSEGSMDAPVRQATPGPAQNTDAILDETTDEVGKL